MSVANATNYTKLSFDLIQVWAKCSEAEKEFITRYSFTLTTANDVNVGLDFAHKKYVNSIRDTTGKIYQRGSDGKIEHAGLFSVELRNDKDIKRPIEIIRNYGSVPVAQAMCSRLRTRNTRVFCKIKFALHQRGIFYPRTDDSPIPDDDKRLYSPKDLSSELHCSLLRMNSIGRRNADLEF
jgi:hypothetical protein